MGVVVVHEDPSARPRCLSKKQTLRHSLQTSYTAFPAFPALLLAVEDGDQALPVSLPSPRGFLSLLSEPARIEVAARVGFALPPCPWLSHVKEAKELTDLSWIIRWK